MIPYWILFAIPAWRALAKPRLPWGICATISIWLVLVIFIGLRVEVGGDWVPYLGIVNEIGKKGTIAGIQKEQVYMFLNLISYNLGMGIYGVNLVCAALFSAGLVCLCKSTPRPWLALTMAVPYLIIVVSMGYTRQAVSIGMLMFAYLALSQAKVVYFIISCAIAAGFQQTSLVVLPLAIPYLYAKRWINTLIKTLLVFFAGYSLYQSYFADRINLLLSGYLRDSAEAQSEGALVRVALNFIPALIFLIYGHRASLKKSTLTVWRWISLLCLICGVALFTTPSSTVVDRLALYALPIQIFIAARIPDLRILKASPKLLNFSVVLFAFLVQFVWLFFSVHAHYWVPYKNLIFE